MKLNLIIVFTNFAVLIPFSASLSIFSNKVKLNEVPYVAAIHENDTFLCSATIVDAEWILAPSGCVHDNKPYLVSTGLNSFKKFARFKQTVAVKTVFFMYSAQEGETVAVVQLDEKFSFNENVSAISIVNDGDIEVLLENNVDEAYIAGWGQPNGNKVRNLERAAVKLEALETCSSKMKQNRFTEALNVCLTIKMKDFLITYYGGPLVVANRLIAINLRRKNFLFSVYTKVNGVLKSFIDTHVLHVTPESGEFSTPSTDHSSYSKDEAANIVTSSTTTSPTSTEIPTTTTSPPPAIASPTTTTTPTNTTISTATTIFSSTTTPTPTTTTISTTIPEVVSTTTESYVNIKIGQKKFNTIPTTTTTRPTAITPVTNNMKNTVSNWWVHQVVNSVFKPPSIDS